MRVLHKTWGVVSQTLLMAKKLLCGIPVSSFIPNHLLPILTCKNTPDCIHYNSEKQPNSLSKNLKPILPSRKSYVEPHPESLLPTSERSHILT